MWLDEILYLAKYWCYTLMGKQYWFSLAHHLAGGGLLLTGLVLTKHPLQVLGQKMLNGHFVRTVALPGLFLLGYGIWLYKT